MSSTYSDLCWVPWDVYVTQTVPSVWEANDVLAKYPNYVAWHERLMQRPAVRKAESMSERAFNDMKSYVISSLSLFCSNRCLSYSDIASCQDHHRRHDVNPQPPIQRSRTQQMRQNNLINARGLPQP
ncbi:hypothetical protein CDD80_4821 [Ophiocordyceps camponoti-rufipedis]|uniref:GST C-terminal domain-containing protein n=1 Tax=Ophiocordyceps camponoti-rufipedis TaxID=2004952 RepID=A0A2C5YYC6_9HYPO|nr:hypothetical protein CDD80_4821 [Ophiocordyceps camponoti-rufipedis]